MTINEKVEEVLKLYPNGTQFFDHLDLGIKQDARLMHDLFEMVYKNSSDNYLFIASGEFALAAANFGYQIDFFVPGGLRADPSKIDFSPFEYTVSGTDYVFIDDSYFLGRTQRAIQSELRKFNSTIVKTFVAYDGSIKKRNDVESLYRYYDHYDLQGRRLDK